jgi:peptidylprolyl isomerase
VKREASIIFVKVNITHLDLCSSIRLKYMKTRMDPSMGRRVMGNPVASSVAVLTRIPVTTRAHLMDRRSTLMLLPSLMLLAPQDAQAGFNKEKKKKLTDSDYTLDEELALKVADLSEGKGDLIKMGDSVVVHFDVLYRGIDVASSRSARLLGANRTIAEPYEFSVGGKVDGSQVKKINDSAGGLFSGQGGPKPPPCLSRAVIGMRKGGRRSVLIENMNTDGYGAKGLGEMPGGVPFTLNVEVLNVSSK